MVTRRSYGQALARDNQSAARSAAVRPRTPARPAAPSVWDLLTEAQPTQGASLSGSISDSYDQQISAITGMGTELDALTDQLIGSIQGSARATQDQIGGFFGHAADQANAGRPVIAETHDTAAANVDSIYDQLAGSLSELPAQSVARASDAAGGAVGGSVAGRVAAASAPFAAAGETARANAKGNLAQHSAAGQTYLSQLAAAAPSEAAQAQAGVAGRASQAVTESQMALAQQRAQISSQAAALEGAKQRALLEHSADLAGSTFDRMMDTARLFDTLGADKTPLLNQLGLEPEPGDGMDYMDQLNLALTENRLAEATNPMAVGGDRGFDLALRGTSPTTQHVAGALREHAEAQGLDLPGVNALFAPGEGNERLNPEMLALLEDLLGGFQAFDVDTVKDAFRAWYQ